MMFEGIFKRGAVLRDRIGQAKACQQDATLLHDPIEDDPQYADVFAQVDREVDELLKDRDHGLGFCHLVWRHRKKILKQKHGVKWFSPGDMNPGCRID